MKYRRKLFPGGGSLPYWQRPRSQKKAAYIRCKNQIRESSRALGGKFISDDYLHGQNTIVWIAFLGRRQPKYFRAALSTCAGTYARAIDDVIYAYEADRWSLAALFSLRKGASWMCPNPIDYVRDLLADEFDSGVRLDESERAHARRLIADAGVLAVQETWWKRPDYEWGCGLRGSVNVSSFSVDNINAFIDRFLASGCEDYESGDWISFGSSDLPADFIDDGPLMTAQDWASLGQAAGSEGS
jgi:hypothetical protein